MIEPEASKTEMIDSGAIDLLIATPMPIEGLSSRLGECVRCLKETGSLAVILEWDRAYDMKPLLDTAFGGEAHLRNEIIWVTRKARGGIGNSRGFSERHRTILWYLKNPDVAGFECLTMPRSVETRKRFGDGRIVSSVNPRTKRRAPTRVDGASHVAPLNDVWVYDMDQSSWVYELDEINGNGSLSRQVGGPLFLVQPVRGGVSADNAVIERLRTLAAVPSGGVVLETFI